MYMLSNAAGCFTEGLHAAGASNYIESGLIRRKAQRTPYTSVKA